LSRSVARRATQWNVFFSGTGRSGRADRRLIEAALSGIREQRTEARCAQCFRGGEQLVRQEGAVLGEGVPVALHYASKNPLAAVETLAYPWILHIELFGSIV